MGTCMSCGAGEMAQACYMSLGEGEAWEDGGFWASLGYTARCDVKQSPQVAYDGKGLVVQACPVCAWPWVPSQVEINSLCAIS